MIKRPSAQETEDDLLKFQEEFLASTSSPAATIAQRPAKRKPEEQCTISIKKDVVTLTGMALILVVFKKTIFSDQNSSIDL